MQGIIAPSTGGEHNYILEGPHDAWPKVFAVNVFGAVHIIKAFLPRMIEQGPLPSGKPTFVVTTSSVVGLLNHMPGPYSASKMAVTAICEQLTIELDDLGARAAHITSRSLHPTIASTNVSPLPELGVSPLLAFHVALTPALWPRSSWGTCVLNSNSRARRTPITLSAVCSAEWTLGRTTLW